MKSFFRPRVLGLLLIISFLLIVFLVSWFSEPTHGEQLQGEAKVLAIEKPIEKPKETPKEKPPPSKPAKRATKTTPRPKPVKKPKPQPKVDPRIVFSETFQSYELGDIVDWGENLVVVRRHSLNWLSSQVDGKKYLVLSLNFPRNWIFSFDSDIDCGVLDAVMFDNQQNNTLLVNTSHRGLCYRPMTIRLPNGASAVTPYSIGNVNSSKRNVTRILFEFTWIDEVLKVKLNGVTLVSGRFTGYGRFVRVRIVWGGIRKDKRAFFRNFRLYNMTSNQDSVKAANIQAVPKSTSYEEKFRDLKIENPNQWDYWYLHCPCHPSRSFNRWSTFMEVHRLPSEDIGWFKKRFPQIDENKEKINRLFKDSNK